MAKFLTTTEISASLERIIKGADKKLWIISPYLQINDRIKDLLKDKGRSKKDASQIDIRVIYRENKLPPEEKRWLESISSIKTRSRSNLHAKCYFNDKEALLTSMNLYEYSQVNNDEMGILVSKEQDPDPFLRNHGRIRADYASERRDPRNGGHGGTFGRPF